MKGRDRLHELVKEEIEKKDSSTEEWKITMERSFNRMDCYVRRPNQDERVIVTLLGSVLPDGTVDIHNSYAVPHKESSDQVATGQVASTGMVALSYVQKVFDKIEHRKKDYKFGFGLTIGE